MTVSTWRVCTPPRYTTILVFVCVRAVSAFLYIRFWWVGTSPESGTVDLPFSKSDNKSNHHHPWILLSLCLPKFVYYNLEGFPRCGRTPTHLLWMLSCLFLLCMCAVGFCPFSRLVCDLLLRSRRGLSPKAHCQKSISSSWRALLGQDWSDVVPFLPEWGVTIPWALRLLVFGKTWLLGPVSLRMHASPQTLWNGFT